MSNSYYIIGDRDELILYLQTNYPDSNPSDPSDNGFEVPDVFVSKSCDPTELIEITDEEGTRNIPQIIDGNKLWLVNPYNSNGNTIIDVVIANTSAVILDGTIEQLISQYPQFEHSVIPRF